LVEVTVAIKVAREAVEMVRSLASSIQRARQRADDVREAKKLLGLADPQGEAYRSDAVHPLFAAGQLHPDNEAALTAAASDALVHARSVEEDLQVDAAERSLLLFGSPTSEGLSRIVFGYEEVAGVEGLVWRDSPLDLAYAWELDPGRVGDGRVGRHVSGKGIVERPLWQINDLRGNGSERLVPEADADGLLSEDYLLVTRVRNFLSENARARGQFLVSFGGAHGTGTRAVELLLRDKRVLRTVLERLKEKQMQTSGRLAGLPKAYQLLFRVSRISHGAKGSIPRALELVDATILPDTDMVWDQAYRRIAPRLELWRPESGGSSQAQ
jgi:hypothetical protein